MLRLALSVALAFAIEATAADFGSPGGPERAWVSMKEHCADSAPS